MIKIMIPARLQSNRLENKINLAMPNGKTMVEWVYDKAKEFCNYIDDHTSSVSVHVITDSPLVAGYFNDSILVTDLCNNGFERIRKAIINNNINDDELIINWQCDEVSLDFNKICKLYSEWDDSYDMITGHITIEKPNLNNVNDVKIAISDNKNAIYFSRNDIPYNCTYINKHIGLYMCKAGLIKEIYGKKQSYLEKVEKLEQLRVLENGYKISTIEFDYFNHESINTIEDYKEFMYAHGIECE